MLALAVPLVGLYEISVLLVVWMERQRARDAAARAAKEAAEEAAAARDVAVP
jgi:Sec-independent protein secretion pathway component TatC